MKEAILRYVKFMKRLTLSVCIPLLVLLMVSLIFSFLRVIGFMIIGGASLVALFAVYGWYQISFSMGTVIRMEVTEEVVYIYTNRKTFTYDAVGGCIGVKETAKNIFARLQRTTRRINSRSTSACRS